MKSSVAEIKGGRSNFSARGEVAKSEPEPSGEGQGFVCQILRKRSESTSLSISAVSSQVIRVPLGDVAAVAADRMYRTQSITACTLSSVLLTASKYLQPESGTPSRLRRVCISPRRSFREGKEMTVMDEAIPKSARLLVTSPMTDWLTTGMPEDSLRESGEMLDSGPKAEREYSSR